MNGRTDVDMAGAPDDAVTWQMWVKIRYRLNGQLIKEMGVYKGRRGLTGHCLTRSVKVVDTVPSCGSDSTYLNYF